MPQSVKHNAQMGGKVKVKMKTLMSRKSLKRRAMVYLKRYVYREMMGDADGAEISRRMLWNVCSKLAIFGTLGAQGWFDRLVNA